MLGTGKHTNFVWEGAAGGINEDAAARRMATMVSAEKAHYTGPSEGKMLLMAEVRGILRVDTELLWGINSIGDITISILPGHYPAEAGARLVSMRIVPLVTREEQIIRWEELCSGRKLPALRPYKH